MDKNIYPEVSKRVRSIDIDELMSEFVNRSEEELSDIRVNEREHKIIELMKYLNSSKYDGRVLKASLKYNIINNESFSMLKNKINQASSKKGDIF